jgi:hypothetical protein
MVGPLALARVLLGLVIADDAARADAEQPVMTGEVARHSAYDRTPEAPFRRGRRWTQKPVMATANGAGIKIAFIRMLLTEVKLPPPHFARTKRSQEDKPSQFVNSKQTSRLFM